MTKQFTIPMTRALSFLVALTAPVSAYLHAADIQSNYSYQSTITSDGNGPLDLLAELNYDDAQTNLPLAVVMHGYSPSSGNLRNVRANAQRLRDNGFFAISVAMRGRDGSDGVRDSGGLEIHDIYDAVEAVKADPAFAGLIDPTNVHITGYSGGGGNTMSALTKFPDYFRVGASYFGMSDYGYNLTNGWYNKGAGSRNSQLNIDIGNPNTGGNPVLDRYEDFNNNSSNDANELQSWPHGFPSANQQDAGELWYRDRLLAGSIPQPVLNDSDELYVAGFVKTSKFDCWLGDGQNAAASLTYSLSDSLMTFSMTILSSDTGVTGDLTIDTACMGGREITVELNDVVVGTIDGGDDYTYNGLAHNDTLELIDSGPAVN